MLLGRVLLVIWIGSSGSLKKSNLQTITDHDQQYIGLLKDVSFKPVFIMGDHRSGTTLLYQLLTATQSFNVLTAYHIIRYGELLHNYLNDNAFAAKEQLANYFAKIGLNDRIIDRVKVTPDLPEEYGFLLTNVRFRAMLNSKNLSRFMEVCKKVQFVSNPGRPLLLKNPWDYLNFMYVKRALPEAKFIFIHRNPIHIMNSQLKAIRSIFTNKNMYTMLIASWYHDMFERNLQLRLTKCLFSPHFELGFKVVNRHVRIATNYFLRHVHVLSEHDYICVRYEDICAEPKASLTKIMTYLGASEIANVDYRAFIQPRPIKLLPEVDRNRINIFTRLKPYFNYCRYDFVED